MLTSKPAYNAETTRRFWYACSPATMTDCASHFSLQYCLLHLGVQNVLGAYAWSHTCMLSSKATGAFDCRLSYAACAVLPGSSMVFESLLSKQARLEEPGQSRQSWADFMNILNYAPAIPESDKTCWCGCRLAICDRRFLVYDIVRSCSMAGIYRRLGNPSLTLQPGASRRIDGS
jgi:hypothetical protein